MQLHDKKGANIKCFECGSRDLDLFLDSTAMYPPNKGNGRNVPRSVSNQKAVLDVLCNVECLNCKTLSKETYREVFDVRESQEMIRDTLVEKIITDRRKWFYGMDNSVRIH